MPTFEITSPDGRKFRVTAPEGATKEQALARVRAQALPQTDERSAAGDFFKSMPRGALSSITGMGAGMAQTDPGYAFGQAMSGQTQSPPSGEDITRLIEQNVTGDLPKPQGLPGQIGASLAETAVNPLTYIGPGGMPAKLATGALSAVGGELGAEAARGTELETPARIAGGVIGAGLPRGGAKTVTPLPTDPRRLVHVENLRRQGIEPTAGDVTGNRALKRAESALGDAPGAGQKYAEAKQGILDKFTKAVLAKIGENATEATPEVLDRAHKRIGGMFDKLAENNSVQRDAKLVNDVLDAENDYKQITAHPAPAVSTYVGKIVEDLHTAREMSGQQYKVIASEIRKTMRESSDPELKKALGKVKESLDDAMERSMKAAGSPDLGAWQIARNQYRNLMIVDGIASGAGDLAQAGTVTPEKLRAAITRSKSDKVSHARGRGDFSELARSGEVVLKPTPSSQTSERAFLLHQIPTAIAAGAGALMGGAPGAAIGAAMGAAMPPAAGKAIMSKPVQEYLKNQTLADFLRKYPSLGQTSLQSVLDQLGPLGAQQ